MTAFEGQNKAPRLEQTNGLHESALHLDHMPSALPADHAAKAHAMAAQTMERYFGFTDANRAHSPNSVAGFGDHQQLVFAGEGAGKKLVVAGTPLQFKDQHRTS